MLIHYLKTTEVGEIYLHFFMDLDNQFDNKKLSKFDFVTVNRNPTTDNEPAEKLCKYLAESLGEETILRFNQTLENNLEVSVGNNVYNLTKHDTKQSTDTTVISYPKRGGHLPQQWIIKCNDKKTTEKQKVFQNKTNTSPTGKRRSCSPTCHWKFSHVYRNELMKLFFLVLHEQILFKLAI